MRRKVLAASAAVVVLLIALFVARMFRTESIDTTERGVIMAKYRWGALQRIEYDENADGRIDAWEHLSPGAVFNQPTTWRATSTAIDENFDGTFDIEYETRVRGELKASVYWIDQTGDGHFDVVLLGEEGRQDLADLMTRRGRQLLE